MSIPSATLSEPVYYLAPIKAKMIVTVLSQNEILERFKQDNNLNAILANVPEQVRKGKPPTYTIQKIPKRDTESPPTQMEIVNYTAKKVLFDKNLSLKINGNHVLYLHNWGLFSKFSHDSCQSVFFGQDGHYFMVNKDIPKYTAGVDTTVIQTLEINETRAGYLYRSLSSDYYREIPIPRVIDLEEIILKVSEKALNEFSKRITLRYPGRTIDKNACKIISISPTQFGNSSLGCISGGGVSSALCLIVNGFIITLAYFDKMFRLHATQKCETIRSPDIHIEEYPVEVLNRALKTLSGINHRPFDIENIIVTRCEKELCMTKSLKDCNDDRAVWREAPREQRYSFAIEADKKIYSIIVNEAGEQKETLDPMVY